MMKHILEDRTVLDAKLDPEPKLRTQGAVQRKNGAAEAAERLERGRPSSRSLQLLIASVVFTKRRRKEDCTPILSNLQKSSPNVE